MNDDSSAPPVPILGVGAGDGAPLQPWSRGVRPGAFLVARYTFDAADYRRCTFAALREILPFLLYLYAGLAIFFVAAASVLLVFVVGITFSTIPAPVWDRILSYAALIAFGNPVLTLLLIVAGVWLVGWVRARKSNDAPVVLIADAEGVHYERAAPMLLGGAARLPWARIQKVLLKNGDVRFVPHWSSKNRVTGAAYVPRSAFADDDAAKRFADAATALLAARGDVSQVDAAALAEFRG